MGRTRKITAKTDFGILLSSPCVSIETKRDIRIRSNDFGKSGEPARQALFTTPSMPPYPSIWTRWWALTESNCRPLGVNEMLCRRAKRPFRIGEEIQHLPLLLTGPALYEKKRIASITTAPDFCASRWITARIGGRAALSTKRSVLTRTMVMICRIK